MIKRSSEFLTRKEVESPRLQAELLLAHVLQLPRLKLYLNFERTLTETEVEVLRKLVKRRGDREPLQHILGSTSFCGLEMDVNGSVLIPRPETELLAERAWKFLNQLSSSAVLDLGTGTGCLAITLALRRATSSAAFEISKACTAACGFFTARVIARQPVPVPRSSTAGEKSASRCACLGYFECRTRSRPPQRRPASGRRTNSISCERWLCRLAAGSLFRPRGQ